MKDTQLEQLYIKQSEFNLLTMMNHSESYNGGIKINNFELSGKFHVKVSYEVYDYVEVNQEKCVIGGDTLQFYTPYFLEKFSELFNSYGILDSKLKIIRKLEPLSNFMGDEEYIIFEEVDRCDRYIILTKNQIMNKIEELFQEIGK